MESITAIYNKLVLGSEEHNAQVGGLSAAKDLKLLRARRGLGNDYMPIAIDCFPCRKNLQSDHQLRDEADDPQRSS